MLYFTKPEIQILNVIYYRVPVMINSAHSGHSHRSKIVFVCTAVSSLWLETRRVGTEAIARGINIDDTTRQPTRDTAMNAVLALASQPRSLSLAASQPQPGPLGFKGSSFPACLLCAVRLHVAAAYQLSLLLLLVCLRILQFSYGSFPIEFSIQFTNWG